MCMCKFTCNLCVVVVWVDPLNHDHAANHTSVPPEGLAAKMRKTFGVKYNEKSLWMVQLGCVHDWQLYEHVNYETIVIIVVSS